MRKLTIRNLTAKDVEVLQGLHRTNGDLPFPDFNNQLYCCNRVVVDEQDSIVGVGTVRLTSEAILMLDRSRPTVLKARAIKLLIPYMKKEVQALGMDETHAFVDEEHSRLRRLLQKVFGFVECQSKTLYLQF